MRLTGSSMSMSATTSDVLAEAVAAYRAAGGNAAEASRQTGIPPTTFKDRLQRAAAAGLIAVEGETPPGFSVSRTTTLYGPDGVKQQWVRRDREQVTYEAAVEAISAAFEQWKGPPRLPFEQPAGLVEDDLLTVYVVGDHHLGMYSWWRETGESYDVDIAEKLLLDTMRELVAETPRSSTAVVLNVGDFFHADDDNAATRRSGNSLDFDTRYAKVLQVGVDLMVQTIAAAASKHNDVYVVNVMGNHDPYATLALRVALASFFHADPMVHVDTSPAPYWVFPWGSTLLVSTHGDMAKPDTLPGTIAAYFPQLWGASKYRYALLGHVHSKNLGGEKQGLVWESFQTLAPKDQWHRAMGYASGRSMTAVTYDRQRGERSRNVLNIGGPSGE